VRAQWALEASLSANPRRSLAGLAVLNDLKTSSLATREDRALFRLIALTAQDELVEAAAGGGAGAASGPEARGALGGEDSLLESALRAQVDQLLGKRPEASSFLLGSPGTPTEGETGNH